MFLETRYLSEDDLPVAARFALPSLEGIRAEGELVSLTGNLQRQNRGFRLSGRLRMSLGMPCSRCTTQFKTPVEIDIDLLFIKGKANQETPAPPEDLELTRSDCSQATLDSEERIDLVALARDQIYLWIPLKAICRSDCKGLCNHCGANFNQAPCACASTWIDPRLAPLAELKKNT